MSGHVIISHGLQSSPEASKATALAAVADSMGWSHERPDFCDLDRVGELGDVPGRIARLAEIAARHGGRLVLAGSSMGAFISARVSLQVAVAGLFLMAPPVTMRGVAVRLEAAPVATRVIHGWHDELIPAMDVVRWAEARSDHATLVNDSHRLAGHVGYCADEFGRFLQALS